MAQLIEQGRQFVPQNLAVFQPPPPSLYGKVVTKNSQGVRTEFLVPFVQEEVDTIRLFRRELKKICESGYHQVPFMLMHAPLPSGGNLRNRKEAIEQMRETAQALERVLALNQDFKSRISVEGRELPSLRRTIRVLGQSGETEEVQAPEGLRRIVDFVHERYGKPDGE